MKCIHFRLPSGAGGMAAAHQLGQYRTKVSKFCVTYKIQSYNWSVEGYNFYVWFDEEKIYSLFFLVWEDARPWSPPTIAEKEIPENYRLAEIKL